MVMKKLQTSPEAWIVAAIIALCGYAATGFSGYVTVNSRLTALEAHQADNATRLDRIENKIDAILFAINPGVNTPRQTK